MVLETIGVVAVSMSITSSVAAILNASYSLLAVIREIKDIPEYLVAIARELSTFIRVLEKVDHEFRKSIEASGKTKDFDSLMAAAVGDCSATCKEIEEVLEKLKSRSFMARVRNASERKSIELLHRRLEANKSTLTLLLAAFKESRKRAHYSSHGHLKKKSGTSSPKYDFPPPTYESSVKSLASGSRTSLNTLPGSSTARPSAHRQSSSSSTKTMSKRQPESTEQQRRNQALGWGAIYGGMMMVNGASQAQAWPAAVRMSNKAYEKEAKGKPFTMAQMQRAALGHQIGVRV